MKKYLAALSATALISIAPYALAASSVDLTVTGTITPAACMPSFSDGGVIDHGKILAKDLSQTGYTMYRSPIDLTVTCDAPALFALKGIDNKPGTASDNRSFGLGMTDANEKLGAFAPYVLSVEADGNVKAAITSDNDGTTWSNYKYMIPNSLTAVSEVSSLTPIAAQHVLIKTEVRTWIARADGLTLTNEVAIDGSATFEVKYL